MSFKTSRRAKSILAIALITSNFVNSKINAMESKSGQNQNTYQQQNKTRWQIRGEEAVKDEKNLLFEGLIADPKYLCWIVNNTVNYCQHVHDEAKKLGIKLLPRPSLEQREKLGITFGKCCYNKLLTLSDNKQVLGCQIISAHLIKQLTRAC